jgi:hypothetical protein
MALSMAKLLEGEELKRRCRELGIDTQGTPRTQSLSGNSPQASDRVWMVALASAIASVVSAVTALVALHMSK